MNIYEQIQQSIDYIEDNLDKEISIRLASSKAYMSLSYYYKAFYMLTGYSVKDYIRHRRISLASTDILEGDDNMLNIALKYGFKNGDTFSKAFKKIVGCTPTAFKEQKQMFYFERVNMMDIIIRELHNDELKLAVELNYQCWNEDFAGVIPNDSMNATDDLAFITNWINDKECDDVRHIYGAFVHNQFAGFVGGSFTDVEIDVENGVELNYLFVKKQYRKMAIGLKLVSRIVTEFKDYGIDKFIVYNWHESDSNKFYRMLGGEVLKQVTQKPKGQDTLVDVFYWDINKLSKTLDDKIHQYDMNCGEFSY